MTNYGIVKSSTHPQEIEITPDKVFIASNIEEYIDNIEGKEVHGFKYDYTSYSKDEYLMYLIQNQKN